MLKTYLVLQWSGRIARTNPGIDREGRQDGESRESPISVKNTKKTIQTTPKKPHRLQNADHGFIDISLDPPAKAIVA